MAIGQTIGIVSAIYAGAAVLAAAVFIGIWGKPNVAMTRAQAIKFIIICVVTGAFLMWVFWITALLAQWHPMIEPQHKED